MEREPTHPFQHRIEHWAGLSAPGGSCKRCTNQRCTNQRCTNQPPAWSTRVVAWPLRVTLVYASRSITGTYNHRPWGGPCCRPDALVLNFHTFLGGGDIPWQKHAAGRYDMVPRDFVLEKASKMAVDRSTSPTRSGRPEGCGHRAWLDTGDIERRPQKLWTDEFSGPHDEQHAPEQGVQEGHLTTRSSRNR